jgi:hypothetical protein
MGQFQGTCPLVGWLRPGCRGACPAVMPGRGQVGIMSMVRSGGWACAPRARRVRAGCRGDMSSRDAGEWAGWDYVHSPLRGLGRCSAWAEGSGRVPGGMSSGGAGAWAGWAYVHGPLRGLGMCSAWGRAAYATEAGPDLKARPGFRVVGFRAAKGAWAELRGSRRGSHCE